MHRVLAFFILAISAMRAEAAPFLYVTTSNNVAVIDVATNNTVATIQVGSLPDAVAITPDGKHAYVANISSDNISVIDTTTNNVVATIPVGTRPVGVAVTPPDGKPLSWRIVNRPMSR